jgi:hypothetical protein
MWPCALRTAVYGAIDIIAAMIVMFALALLVVIFTGTDNLASGVALFDWPQIFADRRDPVAQGDYTWITLTLVSTLPNGSAPLHRSAQRHHLAAPVLQRLDHRCGYQTGVWRSGGPWPATLGTGYVAAIVGGG